MSTMCSTEELDLLDLGSKEIFNKQMDANKAYTEFLYNKPTSQISFEEAVEESNLKIKSEKKKLKSINKKSQSGRLRAAEITNNIKELEKIRDINDSKAQSWDQKSKVLNNIQTLIMNQWATYADSKMYEVNPWKLFPVIKKFTQDLLNKQYNTLDDLHIKDLKSIFATLKLAFDKANLRAKKAAKLNRMDDEFTNPAKAMFLNDPTGVGYNIVMKAQALGEEVYGPVNKYSNKIAGYYRNIDDYLRKQLNLNLGELPQQRKEMYDAIVEIMDEQLLYQTATPIMQYNPKQKKWQWNGLKENIDRVKSIVARNKKLGLEANGDVKVIEIAGQRIPYVLVEQIAEDNGKETWNAYEIPHTVRKDGNIVLIHPSQQQDWANYFQSNTRKLADTDMEDGVKSKGLLPAGWYRTTEHQIRTANYNTKDEFKVESYVNYVPDNFQHDNDALWQAIKGIKEILIEVYNLQKDHHESIKELYDQLIDKILIQSKSTIAKQDMTTKDLKEMIKSITNMGGLNINFSMEGGEIQHGSLNFNQRRHHVPRMYDPDVYFAGLKRGISDVTEKIVKLAADLKKPGAKMSDKKILAELIELKRMYDQSSNWFLGLEDDVDISTSDGKVNSIIGSKYAKSRSMMMRPLKQISEGVVVNRGMRKDPGIWGEYIETSIRSIKEEDLTFEVGAGYLQTDPIIMDHMVDYVRSSIGHNDIQASILGFDISDKKMVERIQKGIRAIPGFGNVTINERNFNMYSQWISSLMSASMLQGTSPMTNNTQRLSFIVNNGVKLFADSFRYTHGLDDASTREKAFRAAEEAGVTDVLVALADTLTSITGDTTIFSGPVAIADLVLIRLDMNTFIQNSMGTTWDQWLGSAVDKAYQRLGPDMDRVAAIKDMKKDVWLAINGLTDQDITLKERKLLINKLKNWFTTEQINKFATWALSGGIFNRIPLVKAIASMTGSETTMRVEAFILGSMKLLPEYGGYLEVPEHIAPGGEMDWVFTQKEAIDAGIVEVRQTMFGITNAYMPKVMKGATGRQLFKFKLFPYKQGGEEYKLLNNYANIQKYDAWLKGADPGKLQNIMNTLISGGKLLVTHPPKLNDDTTGDLSEIEKQVRLYVYLRVTASIINDMLNATEIVTKIYSILRKFLGYRVTAGAQHGTSAILPSTLMAFLKGIGGLYLLGIGDEEEGLEWIEAFSFIFLPASWNILGRAYFKDQSLLEATGEVANIMFLTPFRPLIELGKYGAETAYEVFD